MFLAAGERLHSLLSEAERQLNSASNGDDKRTEAASTTATTGRKTARPRTKLAVMRSTNSFIDTELRRSNHGNQDDSFADLEDFIVCPEGHILWE